MPTMETLLDRDGQSLLNIREADVYEVLAGVPWARVALAEYVQRHRPDLRGEVRACLEELGTGEE